MIWELSFPRNVRFLKKYIPVKDSRSESNDERREEVDIAEQVKKYQLSGGSIINVVHYASIKALEKFQHDKIKSGELNSKQVAVDQTVANQFFALEEEANSTPQMTIYLTDVLDGIKKELLKEGKPFS